MARRVVIALLFGLAEASELFHQAPSAFAPVHTNISTLSKRGARNAAWQNIPWRFAPGASNRYHKDTNRGGVIAFATAENACVDSLPQIHIIMLNRISFKRNWPTT
jgi:hypothetical protein